MRDLYRADVAAKLANVGRRAEAWVSASAYDGNVRLAAREAVIACGARVCPPRSMRKSGSSGNRARPRLFGRIFGSQRTGTWGTWLVACPFVLGDDLGAEKKHEGRNLDAQEYGDGRG